MKKLKLSQIRIDGGTQIRTSMDAKWIQEIVENMKNDVEYPPIQTVFDGDNHWLVDGFHRYYALQQMGIKETTVEYKPGTLQDAQLAACRVNSTHGKPRTREDKINAVKMAKSILGDVSNYEIAKTCNVSQPFVAAVLDEAVRQKQKESKLKSTIKKAAEATENTNPISIDTPKESKQKLDESRPDNGHGPDEKEQAALDLALQQDIDMFQKLLESDDKLSEAWKEVERVHLINAKLTLRIEGLMNEKNEAIKLVKSLQKELQKLKG